MMPVKERQIVREVDEMELSGVVLLTTAEASAQLGVSRRTVHEWIRRGLLAAYLDPVSRRTYVVREDVQGLVPARRLKPVRMLAKVEAHLSGDCVQYGSTGVVQGK